MSVDTIGDFLTIIRNGIKINKQTVKVSCSKLKTEVAKALMQEGYIKNYNITNEGAKSFLTIHLKYVKGEPVIHEIVRVSTPGRRYYERGNSLTPIIGGLGVSILTTSAGILTDRQAREKGIGGEVICRVW
jgi:small subunit ribosomal protein S8